MQSYVIDFTKIDKTNIDTVGGKGANLGALSKINNLNVPTGFCITTEAFKKIIGESIAINKLLDQLATLTLNDKNDKQKISTLSADLRQHIESTPIPTKIREEIIQHITALGENTPYAVRSSATAEDLPTASFAGQQDTYLNIIGAPSILQHISKCWASLFTERAVIYRIQNGFDHHKVHLSVVIQKMIFPQAAGILFTADPVSSNRKIVSIDASFGLGEALVSGKVSADNYKVRDGKIIDKNIQSKKLAIYASKEGGTIEEEIKPDQQSQQTLTDSQILQLAQTGRDIEAYFGQPQDIEWCLADNTFYIVQSRPITTLYPMPEEKDNENHIYISTGHQQMMTDAMKPLGLSFYELMANRPFAKAGGRLFVDVTPMLASPATRQMMIHTMGNFDPLIKDALVTVLERGDFIKMEPEESNAKPPNVINTAGARNRLKNDPAIVANLIRSSQESIAALRQNIQFKSGSELFDFIRNDLQSAAKALHESETLHSILGYMDATVWLNEAIREWLGDKNVADSISQSVPNNVTAEMGLELLNVADTIRPYPEIIDYLQQTKDENFLKQLDQFNGGETVRQAIESFLTKYGMRCVGEIDITKTRWSEQPITLIPMILSNIKNLPPNEGTRKFEQGKQEAKQKEEELITRLRQLPDGEQKAAEVKEMISLIRNFAGYREYPKYAYVTRNFIHKQALLKEAERLQQQHIIHDKEDIYFLYFDELNEVVHSGKIDYELINKRKEQFKQYEKLTPPRVITSDGEIVMGHYKHENLPANAIAGLAVSSGVVEGRARVLFNIQDAIMEEGDILVTPYTDPSWTPVFVSIKGLITEVGGLMTHGAVVAREYGLPAVVGVENATKLIKDGQRIRVHGTEGYVELL